MTKFRMLCASPLIIGPHMSILLFTRTKEYEKCQHKLSSYGGAGYLLAFGGIWPSNILNRWDLSNSFHHFRTGCKSPERRSHWLLRIIRQREFGQAFLIFFHSKAANLVCVAPPLINITTTLNTRNIQWPHATRKRKLQVEHVLFRLHIIFLLRGKVYLSSWQPSKTQFHRSLVFDWFGNATRNPVRWVMEFASSSETALSSFDVELFDNI